MGLGNPESGALILLPFFHNIEPLYLQSPKVSELLHFTSTAVFVFLLGYRSVPLKNGFNENLELASLLVHVQQCEVRNTHKLISFSLRASFIKRAQI